jgi:threonine/homoserine/homoserine lactone efflux protein
MSADQLIALTLFALAGSFTPGPNNTIATATGANFGLRAALPHVFGVPLGFASMLALGSLGVAAAIVAQPALAQAIQWAGIAYLLLIAWRIGTARSAGDGLRRAKPMTLWQSAAFQYANPKAWMLAAAAAGTYMADAQSPTRTLVICAVFGVTACASLIVWAWVGSALRSWLAVGARLPWFNRTMGALLAATAVWMAV